MANPDENSAAEVDEPEEFEAINAGNEPAPAPRVEEPEGDGPDAEDQADEKPRKKAEPGVLSGGPTGVAGSDLEKRAADRLVEEIENRGREARVQEIRIPPPESATIALHGLLTVAASLVALKSPAIGAAICLITIFSFYSERGLGLRLIGRLIPGRKSRNVLSPPPGPAWENVEVILATGYDLPDSYPVGEWLSRRFSGQFTTDRILFFGGMIGTFAAVMMRALGIEDTALNILQTITTAIVLAVLAAQIDRLLAGTPVATQEDLAPAREVMAAARQADENSEGDSGVAICLFGGEYSSAGGAGGFFSDPRLKLKPECAVINLVRGARSSTPEVTASEGDLMPTRMSPGLAAESPLKPKGVALRAQTAATIARRNGLRATTVVGRGEAGIDVMLDAADGALPENEEMN